MRSSKSRSRNKSNRQRSIGNIINRVFDSSGPEGKVRGTPQQIIDKYLQLARDAQLSNDRVAEQNFLQHAEHYTRMLGEAQREIAREQDERNRQFGGNGQAGQTGNGNGNGNGNANGNANGNGGQGGTAGQPRSHERDRDDSPRPREELSLPEENGDEGDIALPDSLLAPFETPEDDGPGLVETPEMRAEAEAGAKSAEAPRSAPKSGPKSEGKAEAGAEEGDKAAKPRNRRAPRKPREQKPLSEGADPAPQATEAE